MMNLLVQQELLDHPRYPYGVSLFLSKKDDLPQDLTGFQWRNYELENIGGVILTEEFNWVKYKNF